jgi:HPt (histidine-containing phosphotransfer) domain-containing protein
MSEKIVVTIDEDLEEIIPTFLENRKKDLENIAHALNNGDLKTIEVIAHKLAGNAGSYGLHDLGEIGVELEKGCQNEAIEEIKALHQKYTDYMNRLEVVFE